MEEQCVVKVIDKRTGNVNEVMVAPNELVMATTNERHYYVRNIDDKLVMTVAIIKRLKEGDIGIGLAYCADMDNFDRKKGKLLAYGRAERALRRKRNSSRLGRKEVINCIVNELPSQHDPYNALDVAVTKSGCKSHYVNPKEAEKCTFI